MLYRAISLDLIFVDRCRVLLGSVDAVLRRIIVRIWFHSEGYVMSY